jgi:hypothetical protein
VPFVKLVNVIGLDAICVYVGLLFTEYSYVVIGDPFGAEAVKFITNVLFDVFAERPVGADGGPAGVIETALDSVPEPTTLTARSLMLYVVPLVNPPIVTGLDVSTGENAV